MRSSTWLLLFFLAGLVAMAGIGSTRRLLRPACELSFRAACCFILATWWGEVR